MIIFIINHFPEPPRRCRGPPGPSGGAGLEAPQTPPGKHHKKRPETGGKPWKNLENLGKWMENWENLGKWMENWENPWKMDGKLGGS